MCVTALGKAESAVETLESITAQPLLSHVAWEWGGGGGGLNAEKNKAEPILREASNTLNIRKSFPNRASSKLNRRELFARSSHFLLPTPTPPFRVFNRALISLYKWKLNHCIPGWKMIGNESMSEVKT